MFSRISAGLAGCLFWTTSCPVNANFVVEVDGTPTACTFEQQTNSYNTHTATTTDPSLWIPNTFDGKYPTNYDLKYDRDDSSHARGGRCLTESTTTVSGDGLFQAHVYIHTNVAAGTGVFTINAEPQPYDANNELDLIVINVAEGIMKSGKPEHDAASFPISEYQGKWINIHMQKAGQSCTTTISDITTGRVLGAAATMECTLAESSSIVINARARDGSDSGDSFVSVRYVGWQSTSALTHTDRNAALNRTAVEAGSSLRSGHKITGSASSRANAQ